MRLTVGLALALLVFDSYAQPMSLAKQTCDRSVMESLRRSSQQILASYRYWHDAEVGIVLRDEIDICIIAIDADAKSADIRLGRRIELTLRESGGWWIESAFSDVDEDAVTPCLAQWRARPAEYCPRSPRRSSELQRHVLAWVMQRSKEQGDIAALARAYRAKSEEEALQRLSNENIELGRFCDNDPAVNYYLPAADLVGKLIVDWPRHMPVYNFIESQFGGPPSVAEKRRAHTLSLIRDGR